MIRFECDYLEGAHPRLLKALAEANNEQTVGYGLDAYCEEARSIILRLCKSETAAVHFLVGGTQVNRTVIAAALRPHQGVIAAETGHVAVHESGAIENSGHKVLTVPPVDGKLTAAEVDALCRAHWTDDTHEHTVQPGMVYISNPSEIGTIYSRRELEELSAVCLRWSLPLYMDGARLGSALESAPCDYDMAFLAGVCDAFTIGGTKLGALFGEALVISAAVPALQKDFRYLLKQNGGMLAKGRLLGIQFAELLRDGLYSEIGRHENEMALLFHDTLLQRGYRFLIDSPTNQQFPILPDALLEKLREKYSFAFWQDMGGGMSCVRFCASWATRREDVQALLADIPHA